MDNRRHFLRLATAGGAAAVLGAAPAVASSHKSIKRPISRLAGKLFYTQDNGGRWAGKEASHTPVVEVEKNGGKAVVSVTTPHEMYDDHYIVKHILLDAHLSFLGETMFDKANDAPESEYTLTGYSGTVYALSVCNKHDTWMASVDV